VGKKFDLRTIVPPPSAFPVPQTVLPFPLHFQPFSIMFPYGTPQLNLDDLAFSGNNNSGDFGFDGFNYLDASNVAGQSQEYSEVDATVDSNSYPSDYLYLAPSTTPVFLSLANESYPNGGKSRRTFQCLPFKDSPSNLRIHLFILPGRTHTPLVTINGPSVPNPLPLILCHPFVCPNPSVRLWVSSNCASKVTYLPFTISLVPLPRTTHRGRYPRPLPVPPIAGHHQPR
jgi:hypothetical protein